MRKRAFILFFAALFFFASFLSLPLFSTGNSKDILPGHLEFKDWERKEEPEYYQGKGLFGYIDGGAEIFLQYEFKDLFLGRYSLNSDGKEKEIILEVYRMESPADAFGIFSVKRAGDERVSRKIDALNWVSGTQINLVKGEYFINIIGFDCREKELEEFSAFAARRIDEEVLLPAELSLLPRQNLIPQSEKYIRGQLAASADSVLLKEDFWGFEGKSRAVSARYSPSNSKLIIVDFEEEKRGLLSRVRELFEEYLNEIIIKERVVQGKNSAGNIFLFSLEGKKAVLILGERNLDFARSLLEEARERINKGE